MNILVFTNLNRYLSTHEAFRVERLIEWAEYLGIYFFIRRLDDTPKIEHKQLIYSSINPSHQILVKEIQDVLNQIKPKRVVNFLEKFFPWELVHTNAEKVYFLRSCAKKLYTIVREQFSNSLFVMEFLEIYKELSKREEGYLQRSDRVITDSKNSANAIHEAYGLTAEICLSTINPTKYQNLPLPQSRRSAYNVGRRDFQKGLHFVRSPKRYSLVCIGKAEVGVTRCTSDNIKILDCQPFEEYNRIIQDCTFGIFPSIWEGNGYAVQECLAMGKIPVVQRNSGGNEEYCTQANSVIIDFNQGNFDWENVLDQLKEIPAMCENARKTITNEMYLEGLDRFGELICD